ncbi:GRP family sugar transporter, partial [Staphylococcus aureus]|uniref:GRP family sugar transporter n=1 Tax=Staphylococcus aureus TaxID=1280 RepID=UPI0037DA0C0A
MGVRRGFELLGGCLWGVFGLGNWGGIGDKMIGFRGLVVIVIGGGMTVWSEGKEGRKGKNLGG